MTDIASIAIRVDTTDVENASQKLSDLANSSKEASTATSALTQPTNQAAGATSALASASGSAANANNQVVDSQNSVQKALDIAVPLWAKVSAGILGAVAATQQLIQNVLDAADQQVAEAQRLGVTAEQYENLAQAAQYANVEQSAMSGAVRTLSNFIDEASTKGGANAAILREMGITAREPYAAFLQVTDALSKMAPGLDRNALGADLLGKGFMTMVPLIDQGSTAFTGAGDKARTLGIYLDTETKRIAADTADNFELLTAAIGGVATQGVSPLIPELKLMSDNWSAYATNANLSKTASAGITAALAGIVTTVNSVAVVAVTAGEVVGTAFQTIGSTIAGAAAAASLAVRGNFSGAAEAFSAGAENARRKADASALALRSLWNTVDDGGEKLNQSSEDLKKTAEEIRKKALADEAAKASAREHALGIQDVINRLRGQVAATGQSKDAQVLMDLSARGATTAQIGLASQLILTKSQLDATKTATDNAAKSQADMRNAVAGTISRLTDQHLKLTQNDGALALMALAANGATDAEIGMASQMILTNNELKKQQDEAKKSADETAKLEDKMRKLADADSFITANGLTFADAFQLKMALIADKIPSWSASLATAAIESLQAASSGLGNVVAQALTNGASIRDGVETLGRNLANKFITDLVAAKINELVFTSAGAVTQGAAIGAAFNAAVIAGAPKTGAAIAGGGAATTGAGAAAGLPSAGAGVSAGAVAGVAAGAAAVGAGYQQVAGSAGQSAANLSLAAGYNTILGTIGIANGVGSALGFGGASAAALERERQAAAAMGVSVEQYRSIIGSRDAASASGLSIDEYVAYWQREASSEFATDNARARLGDALIAQKFFQGGSDLVNYVEKSEQEQKDQLAYWALNFVNIGADGSIRPGVKMYNASPVLTIMPSTKTATWATYEQWVSDYAAFTGNPDPLDPDAANIQGFANGGTFGGGMRIVGERGPELEFTGPSRIVNAEQTAQLLNGGGNVAAQIESMRVDMQAALIAVARNTAEMARYITRWDGDGLPAERAI